MIDQLALIRYRLGKADACDIFGIKSLIWKQFDLKWKEACKHCPIQGQCCTSYQILLTEQEAIKFSGARRLDESKRLPNDSSVVLTHELSPAGERCPYMYKNICRTFKDRPIFCIGIGCIIEDEVRELMPEEYKDECPFRPGE
jgi:hypothetical protein